MKIYIGCQEEPTGNTRTIKSFNYKGKTYILDECIAGGADVYGEAKGCQNFVCRIGQKIFLIYCEEEFKNGKVEYRYFTLKKG